jgi:hypothetical protein
MKYFLVFIFTLALAACATSSPKQDSFNLATADFSTAKTDNLCAVYGFRWNRAQEARAELSRRNTFTNSEWDLIEARKVVPGLSECAVKAAYPLDVAKYYFHEDTKGNPIGKDLVFSCNKVPVPHCPFTKVEIREGKVTALVPVSEP